MDITHDNVCSSMLSCFYSHLLSTGRPICSFNPKFHGDKMSMGGKLYTKENIHTIQFPELQPERVFSPIRNGIQAYYTKYSPLSNFHPAKFETEGKSFATVEHYFVYKKALHFQDSESASLILKTSDPEKVKQLGKKYKDFKKTSGTKWQLNTCIKRCS